MCPRRSLRSAVLAITLLGALLLPGTGRAICRNCPQYDAIITPALSYKTVVGTLLAAGDCKVFRMPVTGGRSYRATFCEGGGSAAFDTALEVKGTSCLVIGSNADACAGGRSQVDFSASMAGVAYIKVSGQGAGGRFVMAYRDIGVAQAACTVCPSFDFGVLTPTATWQQHQAVLSFGSCRIYKFALRPAQCYTFSLCQGGGGAEFNTLLETFYNTCNLGPVNDDRCEGGGSEVSMVSNSGQYFYVRISGIDGGNGNYVLAYRINAESPCNGSACFDGIDNDGDTLNDCNDPDCLFADGSPCGEGQEG